MYTVCVKKYKIIVTNELNFFILYKVLNRIFKHIFSILLHVFTVKKIFEGTTT